MPIEKPSAHRNHQLNGLEFFVTRRNDEHKIDERSLGE